MKFKRMFFSWLVVLICYEILSHIIHGPLLGAEYMRLMSVWRPNMMDLMWLMYVVDAFVIYMFVYIFTKGYENKGLMEGLRYGFFIGLFINVAGSGYQYIIYPLPGHLVVQWLIYDMIQYVLCGLMLAYVYKRTS